GVVRIESATGNATLLGQFSTNDEIGTALVYHPDGNIYVAGADGRRLFRYTPRSELFAPVGPIVWGDIQVHFASQLQFANNGNLIGAEGFCCEPTCMMVPLGAIFSLDPSIALGIGLTDCGSSNHLNGIYGLAVNQGNDAVVLTDNPGRLV